jgi:hypothetical protein
MITAKKGDIEPWMKITIAMVLIIIFAVFAIALFSGSSQQFTQSFNAKVLSKINFNAIPIPGQIKAKLAQQNGLNAIITVIPGTPACQFEELTLAAFNSYLPQNLATGEGTEKANITFDNVICNWDFDINFDTKCAEYDVPGCDDGNPKNDVDSTGCYVRTTSVAAKASANVQLTLTISGDVPLSGTQDTAKALINTTMYCACTDTARSCLGQDELRAITNKNIQNGDTVTLILPTKFQNQDLKVAGIHMKVSPQGDELLKELKLKVQGDTDVAYAMSGNSSYLIIDGTDEFAPVAGRNLVNRINNFIANNCVGLAVCNIPITWGTNTILQISEISIPYSLNFASGGEVANVQSNCLGNCTNVQSVTTFDHFNTSDYCENTYNIDVNGDGSLLDTDTSKELDLHCWESPINLDCRVLIDNKVNTGALNCLKLPAP